MFINLSYQPANNNHCSSNASKEKEKKERWDYVSWDPINTHISIKHQGFSELQMGKFFYFLLGYMFVCLSAYVCAVQCSEDEEPWWICHRDPVGPPSDPFCNYPSYWHFPMCKFCIFVSESPITIERFFCLGFQCNQLWTVSIGRALCLNSQLILKA